MGDVSQWTKGSWTMEETWGSKKRKGVGRWEWRGAELLGLSQILRLYEMLPRMPPRFWWEVKERTEGGTKQRLVLGRDTLEGATRCEGPRATSCLLEWGCRPGGVLSAPSSRWDSGGRGLISPPATECMPVCGAHEGFDPHRARPEAQDCPCLCLPSTLCGPSCGRSILCHVLLHRVHSSLHFHFRWHKGWN